MKKDNTKFFTHIQYIQKLDSGAKIIQLSPQMTPSESILPKTQSRVRHQSRIKLIQMVQLNRFSIKKACKLANINYSTGKLIMKKYNKKGLITKFSYEKHKSTPKQTILSESIISSEPLKNFENNATIERPNETPVSGQNSVNFFLNFHTWNQCQFYGGHLFQNYAYWPGSGASIGPEMEGNKFCWFF